MGIVEEAYNVKILGSGEQVIVLGHGFGADQSVWKHLVPHLIEDYTVFLYDNMGAGTTNPEYFDFARYSSLEGYGYDLLAILEELKVKQCIFGGHSFSAMVGVIASITCPDLFSKLVLLSTTPRVLNDENYYGGFEKNDVEQIFEGMRNNYDAWCSGFAPLVVSGDMDTVAVQEFSRTLLTVRPDIALRLAKVVFLGDMRHLIPMITVPSHILQSEKDMAVPHMVTEFLQQHLNCQFVAEVMPVGGHLPQLSSPDIVIPVLLRHIRHDITPA